MPTALRGLISQGRVSALELVGVFSVAYPEMEYIWGPVGLLSLAPRKSPSLATTVCSSRRSIGNSGRVNQQLDVCPSLFPRVLPSQAKFTLHASLSAHSGAPPIFTQTWKQTRKQERFLPAESDKSSSTSLRVQAESVFVVKEITRCHYSTAIVDDSVLCPSVAAAQDRRSLIRQSPALYSLKHRGSRYRWL